MNSHLGNIGADGSHFGAIILNKRQVNDVPPLPLAPVPPPCVIKKASVNGAGEHH